MDVINRNNYEAYFLLYADNELSPAERQAVEAFVLSHPDLAAEFKALQGTRLQPDNIIFPAKDLLYRTETPLNINTGNCEEYFILYYDNELNAADKKAVEAFVANNPSVKENFELFSQLTINTEEATVFPEIAGLYRLSSGENYTTLIDYLDNELPATEAKAFEATLQQDAELNKEFQLFSQTKLPADTSVRFPNIESLYRKEEKTRTPVVPMWMRMAAAAAVLLFVAWMAFWRNNGNTSSSTEPVATTTQPSSIVPANNNNNNSTTQPANNNTNNVHPVAGNNDINNQPVNNALNSNTNSNSNVTSVSPVRNNNKQVVPKVPGPEQQPTLVNNEQPERLPEELKKIIDRKQTNETIASVQPEMQSVKAENIYGSNKMEEAKYASSLKEENSIPTMTVMNIPADDLARKSGLKSLGRKVSRFFERKIKNGNPFSIAGVEVALAR